MRGAGQRAGRMEARRSWRTGMLREGRLRSRALTLRIRESAGAQKSRARPGSRSLAGLYPPFRDMASRDMPLARLRAARAQLYGALAAAWPRGSRPPALWAGPRECLSNEDSPLAVHLVARRLSDRELLFFVEPGCGRSGKHLELRRWSRRRRGPRRLQLGR